MKLIFLKTKQNIVRPLLAVTLLLLAISSVYSASILDLTGNVRTRVVWLQGGDTFSGGGKILGIDTDDGKTVQILPAATGQTRPILCTGGTRIVFTQNYKIYVVNWDGSGKRYLTDGYCSDVWQDPSTGKEYAVYRTGGKSTDGVIKKMDIDNTGDVKTIYSASKVGIDYMPWFSINKAGTYAIDGFPWPGMQILNIATGAKVSGSGGCWGNMSGDGEDYVLGLDWNDNPPNHRALVVGKVTNGSYSKIGSILFTPIDGFHDYYHPRFASNNSRYILVTSYRNNNLWDYSSKDVFFVKMNSSRSAIEASVNISNSSSTFDICADAWVGVTDGATAIKNSKIKFNETNINSIKLSNKTVTFSPIKSGAIGYVKIFDLNGKSIDSFKLGKTQIKWTAPTEGVFVIKQTIGNVTTQKAFKIIF